MKILFYAGYSRPVGTSFPLYGSEIALKEIATRLANRGHEVYVASEIHMDQDPNSNVRVLHKSHIESTEVDVLIVSRYMVYFLQYPIKAKKTYIWLHDTILNSGAVFDGPGGPGSVRAGIPSESRWLVANINKSIDGYVLLSPWHISYFKTRYPEIKDDKIKMIGNGGPQPLSKYEKVPGRFIYTSSPVRGLATLLTLFCDYIYPKYPHATLHVIRGREEFDQELFDRLNSGLPGVKYIGYLSNEDMSEEFKQAEIYLYPTSFYETYCISAHEAQAYGCIFIGTELAALKDTVDDRGFLLKGDATSESYRREILSMVDTVMEMGKWSKDKIRKRCYEWASKRTWECRTDEWLRMFSDTYHVVPHLNWSNDPLGYLEKFKEPFKSIPLEFSREGDYHMVVNCLHPDDKTQVPEGKNTLIFSMEPSYNRGHLDPKYLSRGRSINRNLLEWHLSKVLPSEEIVKTKDLSAIVSGEDRLEGHQKRNKFIEYIDDIYTYDLFGKRERSLVNYRGSLKDKDDGVYPYRYHLVMENGREMGYFTEKLLDGILGECLIFYYGAPDIAEWMDIRALIPIDIDDPYNSYNTIAKSIESDEYTKRLPFIRQAKKRLLSLTIYPTVYRLLSGNQHPEILTLVVNLDRRPDRFFAFEDHVNGVIDWYMRLSACDGQTLEMSSVVKDICGIENKDRWWRNPYGGHDNRVGVLGCTLSHYTIWESLLQSSHKRVVVLEDDAYLCNDYARKMRSLLHLLNTSSTECDIVYLGVTDGCDELYGDMKVSESDFGELRICNPTPVRKNGGGTFGYVLSKEGAKKLVDLVKKHPISLPLDWYLIEMYPHMKAYKVWPRMVTSEVAKTDKDSDIQFETRRL